MNIGFVSTWLHRGAAYVTINYAKLVQSEHKVFIYGRGGEFFDEDMILEGVHIHEGYRVDSKDGILVKDFLKWIKENSIDIVIWNEQRDVTPICETRKVWPNVLHGAYIDYYREDTIESFGVYDFLICNTKRHYSVFNWHPQCFYIPWGCDTDLYIPLKRENDGNRIVFFHSMGMSNRKGTDVLVKTFVERNLAQYGAKLVLHTQVNIDSIITKEDAAKYNIEIVEETVSPPGLYYRGDVYVYPAKLDGLGLTLYEAISCGLPVITTDVAPMNEVISNDNGKLVKVKKMYSRSDGYFWPLSEVDEDSLYDALMYYLDHSDQIKVFSENARNDAVSNWSLNSRKTQLLNILKSVKKLDNTDLCNKMLSKAKLEVKRRKRSAFILLFVPKKLFSFIKKKQVNKKYKR